MHLHQFPQLIFAKDGIPLDNPYFADTVNVAPGSAIRFWYSSKILESGCGTVIS